MQPKTIITKSGKTLTVRLPKQADLNQALIYINNLIAEDTYIVMSGEPVTESEEREYLSSGAVCM